MSPRFFSSNSNQLYVSLWSKYRPAILQLMVAAEGGTQQYKFFGHEFKTLNPKEKGYTFTMQAFQGRALNDIRKSATAQDLLHVLSQSKTASELLDTSKYEFVLDKQFTLSVSTVQPEVEKEEETEA
ncbi:MAG: hypothetical protein JNM78_04750 [Cyclobacteriaceae bacterium]|nr:hypothetical protein [Cyclobacteriaceae bacterium]